MDSRRRSLVLAGSAWLAGGLAACGGGGGGDEDTPPPAGGGGGGGGGGSALQAPAFDSPPAALEALRSVTLRVADVDAGSSYTLQADLGGGYVLALAADDDRSDQYSFTPPVGALDAQGQWISGSVALTLTRTRGSESRQTTLSLPLAMPADGAPGTATARMLRATQLMAQQSLSQLGLLGSKLPQGMDLGGAAAAANQLNARYAELEALVRRAMGGESVVLDLGDGVQLPLTPRLLAQLDAHALAIGQAGVTALAGQRRHALAGDPFEDDARTLAQQMAEAARRVSKAVGNGAALAAGIVAIGAGLAGATPLAIAAGGVAATAWMVGTLYGTAVGATLDGGSAALLDGQARWQDFAPTGKFFLDQYLSQAKDKLLAIGGKLPLGANLQDTIALASSAADTYQSLTDLSLLPAFEAGQLNKAGYPPSNFTLSVQATASPYVVSVRAGGGGGANARVRLQVSGTDGYVYNSDGTLVGGSAEFWPTAAYAGSGIVDTINVFDLDGRASASTTVVF